MTEQEAERERKREAIERRKRGRYKRTSRCRVCMLQRTKHIALLLIVSGERENGKE